MVKQDHFAANVEALADRFPQFVLYASALVPRTNFVNKEKIFPTIGKHINSQQIEFYQTLFVYGLGQGYEYLALKSWLAKDKERRVIFLEDDLEAMSQFLHTKEAIKQINDSQVYIYFIENIESKIFEHIAQTHAKQYVEVIASWHYNQSKQEKFLAIKKTLLRLVFYSFASSSTQMRSSLILSQSLSVYKNILSFSHVNKMKETFKGIPAIVCGAGPTLGECYEVLRQVKGRALIITAGTASTLVSNQGITPDINVFVDPNFDEYDHLKPSNCFETVNFCISHLHDDVYKLMNGCWGYLQTQFNFRFNLWFEKCLEIKAERFGDEISVHAHSVSFVALSVAYFLGCGPILLCGVDLGYVDSYRYPKGLNMTENELSIMAKRAPTTDRLMRPMESKVMWVAEQQGLAEQARSMKDILVYTCSEKSAFVEGVDHLSIEDFQAKYLHRQIDLSSFLFQLMQETRFNESQAQKLKPAIETLRKDMIVAQTHIQQIVQEIKKLKIPKENAKIILEKSDLKNTLSYSLFLLKAVDIAESRLKALDKQGWFEQWKLIENLLKLTFSSMNYNRPRENQRL